MDKEKEFLKASLESFKKYLPKRIVEKILSNPYEVKVDSERRVVTVLFGDISGFTALSERLDPEDVIKVINKYFKKMVRIVDKYGGDVDKFIGDAVLVVFGAPVAHSDDPERAVRAALEMQKEMETIEPVYAKGEYVKVTMHIGINTGEVVALNMGVDDRMEYTIMGDNVNLTSRLEGIAKSGEIIISENTYKHIKDIFEFEKLEPVMVKGKKDPIQIYKVLSLKKGLVKEENLNFVGSEDIKKFPDILVEKFVKDGQNFSLFIKGDEGCGKTKYCSLLFDKFDRKNVKIFQLSGQTFFQNIPFKKLKDFVEGQLKIDETDSVELIKNKIDNSLLPDERDGFYLLFGLVDSNNDEKVFNLKVFETSKRFLEKSIGSEKTLFLIDDFDLFDDHSKNIFLKLFNNLLERKNFSTIISSKENIDFNFTDKVVLGSLDFENFKELVEIKSSKRFDEEGIEYLFKRSEGNPKKFVEIFKFLNEKNFLEEKDGNLFIKEEGKKVIPDSLKSIFVSKIDSLKESDKKVIQYTSVLGYRFKKSEVTQYFNFPQKDVDESFKILTDKGFLEFYDKDTYYFSSELFYESVYNSLSFDKRKILHKNIGDYIEKKYFDKNEEILRKLSFHYSKSDDFEKASFYLEKVGDLDSKLFSYKQSVENYSNAISLLEREKRFDRMIPVVIKVVNVLINTGSFNRALELLKEKREIFLYNEEKEIDYLLLEGMIYDRIGEYNRSEEIYKEALKKSLNLKNKQILSKIYNSLGILKSFEGKYEESLEYYNLSLDISIKENNKSDTGSLYLNIGKIHLEQNRFDEAKKYFELSYDLFKDINDKKKQLLSLINLGTVYDLTGNYEKAEKLYQEALKLSLIVKDEIETARIENNLGTIKFLTGKYDDAIKSYQISIKIFEKYEELKGLSEIYSNMGEINFLLGEFEISKEYYEKSLNLCEKTSHKHLKTYTSLNYANLLSFLGYLEKSEEMILTNKDYIEKNNLVDLKIISLNILAKINGLKSYLEKEKELVLEGINLAKKYGIKELEFNLYSTLIKTLIEENQLEQAKILANDVLEYAEKNNNEILVADILASLADIHIRTQDIESISEISSKSFEISQKTKSKLSLLRTYISLSRFYLLTEDFTSCEDILKEAEKIGERIGSLEHILIIRKISDDLYTKLKKDNLRYISLLKGVSTVEKYIARAGMVNRENLIQKRGFINFYKHLFDIMLKMFDVDFIANVVKDFDKNIVIEVLKDFYTIESKNKTKIKNLLKFIGEIQDEKNS
ncbi:MAG: tetratricopeptide repeat protein [candidate division WOR-3 bacterium]